MRYSNICSNIIKEKNKINDVIVSDNTHCMQKKLKSVHVYIDFAIHFNDFIMFLIHKFISYALDMLTA